MKQQSNIILKVGITVFALATMVLYLFTPLFKIAFDGVSTGVDYIEQVWRIGGFNNIASFLLPLIGGVGAIAMTWVKGRGQHILSLAFAMLPVLFYTFMIIRVNAYTKESIVGLGATSLFDFVGFGAWMALLSGVITMIFSFILIYKEYKESKLQTT